MRCRHCGQELAADASRCENCGQSFEPLGTTDDEASTDRVVPDDPPPKSSRPADVRARFVGRLETLHQLKSHFLDSRDSGSLNMVTLVGDPGVGKSRLALEFARSVRAAVPDARVLSGKVRAPGMPGYGPVIQVLCERFGIVEGEATSDAQAKIARGVDEVMPERLRTEVTHLLAHLLNVPVLNSSVVEPLAQVPGQLEFRTYIAVRRFLERDASQQSLLIYFDGVERAGTETVNFIHYLAEGLRGRPVMFLITARPTLFRRHQHWGEGEFHHHPLEVGPLDQDESLSLFRELVPCDELPVELTEVARDRLGGSPRAIEELTRYLVEAGIVSNRAGNWTISPERLARHPLPRTHEEILRARLNALPAGDRDCLEKAASVGEVFWLDGVVALYRAPTLAAGDPDGPSLEQIAKETEKTRPYVQRLLDRLKRRGLVTLSPEGAIPGEEEYRFAYPPIWDLAHELVDAPLRRDYHRLVAQWLELLPQGRSEQLQTQAARHLERAGLGSQAAHRYRRAADAARARYFNERAIRLYGKALTTLGESDIPTRIHLWHDLGTVAQLSGDLDAAIDAFERMLRLSWVVASKAKGAVAFNKMGRVWRHKGNLDLALEYLERGLELFRQTGDDRGVATSLDDVGQGLWMMGRYDDALDRSATALEMRRAMGDKRSIAVSLSNIGNIERSRGLLDAADSCYREAMQLRRSVGDRYGYVVSLTDLGALAFERGDPDQARDTWEDALGVAERIGALPLQMVLLNKIGEAAAGQGKLGDARQRIEHAISLATEMEDDRGYIDAALNLSAIELREGNRERALELAEETLKLAQQRHLLGKVGRAKMALGEVHAATLFDESSHGDQPSMAEECFRNASRVFRELGNEGELARSLRRFGEFLAERGRIKEAKQRLEEAQSIFERLGTRSAKDVQKTIAELGPDGH